MSKLKQKLLNLCLEYANSPYSESSLQYLAKYFHHYIKHLKDHELLPSLYSQCSMYKDVNKFTRIVHGERHYFIFKLLEKLLLEQGVALQTIESAKLTQTLNHPINDFHSNSIYALLLVLSEHIKTLQVNVLGCMIFLHGRQQSEASHFNWPMDIVRKILEEVAPTKSIAIKENFSNNIITFFNKMNSDKTKPKLEAESILEPEAGSTCRTM